jgi:hypothetical protein
MSPIDTLLFVIVVVVASGDDSARVVVAYVYKLCHSEMNGVCAMCPGGCKRHCPVSADISSVAQQSDPGHSTTLLQGIASSCLTCHNPATGAQTCGHRLDVPHSVFAQCCMLFTCHLFPLLFSRPFSFFFSSPSHVGVWFVCCCVLLSGHAFGANICL